MRLPILTISPPIRLGSTLTLIATSGRRRPRSAALMSPRCLSEGCSATVTSALTIAPRRRRQVAVGADHVGSANRRRLPATRRMKLPAMPPMPALSRRAVIGLGLVLGREDGAAHQPLQVVAARDEGVEAVEIVGDGVDGFRFRASSKGRRRSAPPRPTGEVLLGNRFAPRSVSLGLTGFGPAEPKFGCGLTRQVGGKDAAGGRSFTPVRRGCTSMGFPGARRSRALAQPAFRASRSMSCRPRSEVQAPQFRNSAAAARSK